MSTIYIPCVLTSMIDDENNAQLPTPKTPRHRDALSKRVPITPRHRIGLVGTSLTLRTPRTHTTPSNVLTVYNCARKLFTRSADPGPLVGRECEREELHNFIVEGIESKKGRCMYVSGPPGTGKSALVSEICQGISPTEGVKTSYINCMSAKSSKDVYEKLLMELLGDSTGTEQDYIALLRSLYIPKKNAPGPVYVVTLDEIDFLLDLDLEILYTLFEWSLDRSSRLIVLGIANALDLTDRFLPRLKARNLKPRLLPFLPYTAPQIDFVITTKLRSLSSTDCGTASDYVPFLHPTAVQLCSKKIAAQTGDLRKAFDIVRRTIDVVEAETKQRYRSTQSLPKSPSRVPLRDNPNLCSPQQAALTFEDSIAELTAMNAPRATVAHVSRVSAAALSNGTSQRLQSLNLQQKAALCALVSHQDKSRDDASSVFGMPLKGSSAPTVGKLYETYCALCKRENALHPLTSTEFVDTVSGLETLGLIGEQRSGRGFGALSGTPSKRRRGFGEDRSIMCFVDANELKACLEGVGRGILLGLLGCDD
jgi:cell division control protein 6